MKIIKRIARLLILVLFISLACFGVALSPPKERYQDKESRIELVEKKEDEANEEGIH